MKRISVILLGTLILNSCTKKNAPSVDTVNTPGTITIIAGNGDGGAVIKAALNIPTGVAVDGNGNVYIADMVNNRIRKMTSAGAISTIAGNGNQGYSGDGGAAIAGQLANPSRVAVDGNGNVYISDTYNGLIRKVTSSGTISTIAGNMTGINIGDDNAATAVQLHEPYGVAVDGNGNVYIADLGDCLVRKVTPSGTISNIAGIGSITSGNGGGYSGDGGPATSAALLAPAGVAVDGNRNVYIVDNGNNRIRKVNSSGIISTIAGNGNKGYIGDGGPAISAELNDPKGIAVDDSGNVYIADNGNNRIRKVTPSGTISSIAGTGTAGSSGTGGPAAAAELNGPYDIAVDANGNVYIADTYNQRICKINK